VQDTLPAQIENIELLSHLSRERLSLVAQSCMWRRFKRGEQILSRDSESRDSFFVASGKVEVANFSSNGREIAYATIAEGGYFGELSAIDDRPRSAAVTAADDCVVAVMPRTAFIDLIRDDPQVSLTVMNRLANVIRACDDRIMDPQYPGGRAAGLCAGLAVVRTRPGGAEPVVGLSDAHASRYRRACQHHPRNGCARARSVDPIGLGSAQGADVVHQRPGNLEKHVREFRSAAGAGVLIPS
jgi:CRP-like cAMP-binding protein